MVRFGLVFGGCLFGLVVLDVICCSYLFCFLVQCRVLVVRF